MEEMDISTDPALNTGLGTKSEWRKRAELLNYRVGFTQTYLIKKKLF